MSAKGFSWTVEVRSDERTTEQFVYVSLTLANFGVVLQLNPKDAQQIGNELKKAGEVAFRAVLTPSSAELTKFQS